MINDCVGQTIAFCRLPFLAARRQTTNNDGLPYGRTI